MDVAPSSDIAPYLLAVRSGTAVVLILVLIVLILLSGCFSATETAYTSYSTVRMRRIAAKKRSARLALKLSEDYNKVLTTLLIGNNIVNIAAASIATVLFTSVLGEDLGPTISTVVLTVAVLIFGEVTPKTLAKESPERFARLAAYPLYLFMCVCTPFNFIFNVWKSSSSSYSGSTKRSPNTPRKSSKCSSPTSRTRGFSTRPSTISSPRRYAMTNSTSARA